MIAFFGNLFKLFLLFCFGMVVLMIALLWWPKSFSDEDVKNIQTSIRKEFEKRPGVTVEEVSLLKTGARQLTGFARVKSGPIELNKKCTAEMDTDGRNYMWRCD